ncbi:HTH domain-containing protein [Salinigranum halophilum]|uniref:HTH domain-containing protein n=1 Tax=Salinigranum halophilum TaxID=2565931 RepID=UPI0010A7AE25|nr:HTH domain-containing protein [Salinigranum halophilum]
MTSRKPSEDLRVEVWMRDLSPPPGDPRKNVLSRLRAFEAEGFVDEVSVRVWGKNVTVSREEDDEGRTVIRERVSEFQRWAERNGHSLEPAFRWRDQSSMVSEGGNEVIRLPLQCLAVYADDNLVAVFPCSMNGETNTVGDCLARLEMGDFDRIQKERETGPSDRA